MEHYSAKEKNEISFMTTWVKLEGIMLGGISEAEKSKCHKILLICGT